MRLTAAWKHRKAFHLRWSSQALGSLDPTRSDHSSWGCTAAGSSVGQEVNKHVQFKAKKPAEELGLNIKYYAHSKPCPVPQGPCYPISSPRAWQAHN